MADDREKEASEIHRVDTVPPPADSDSDAYSASTKVGEISSATWKALVPPVAGQDHPLRPRAPKEFSEVVGPPSPPASVPVLPPQLPASNAPVDTSDESVPRMYGDDEGDEDEDENEATLLHPSAKLFSLPPPKPPPPRAAPPLPTAPPLPAPSAAPRVPDIVGPTPNDAAWPFAASMVATPQQKDRRRAILLGIAGIVTVVLALGFWLWS